MQELTQFLPYLATGLSVYATLRGHFISKEQAKRDERLALVEKQTSLFWGIVEKHMTTVLHSPHTPDRDKLLEKIQEGVMLTEAEIDELACDLQGIINDPNEIQGNRAAAVFLLACVERYKQCLKPEPPPIDTPC